MSPKKTTTPVETKTTKPVADKTLKATAPKAAKTKSAVVKGTAAVAPRTAPTYEEIARLAAQIWIENGHPHGTAEQDWLHAENLLKAA